MSEWGLKPEDMPILLADDEEGIRKVVGLSLREEGYPVELAGDGQEALERFLAARPAVVITDIRMPRLDGLGLLRRIKEESPDTEVILISGHGDMELAVEGLKLRAADFITKPISQDALDVALSRAAERISMGRRMRDYTHKLEDLARTQAARIVEMERAASARQAVEGMSRAMCGLAGDLEDGLTLFNEMLCFVAIHDRQGRVLSANRLYRERFGDKTGAASAEVYGPGRALDCPVAETLKSGHGLRGKETLVAADGGLIPVVVHTAPIRDAAGEIDMVLEIAADIGEFRRLQEQLRSTQDRLASLGMLLASLSHSIKGVLTALDGAVYKVDAGLARGDEERVRQGWDAAKGLFGRIKSMVLDILFCAKNRAPTLNPVDAREFAERLRELAAPKAAAHGVGLRVNVDDGVGSFQADAGLLSAALVNILENAVDACAADARPHRTVSLEVSRDARGVLLDVRDNGPGMSPEVVDKLFKVFFSTKGAGGTGLGLFIAKHAAEGHGGSIEVRSEPGGGAFFRIVLPEQGPEPDEP